MSALRLSSLSAILLFAVFHAAAGQPPAAAGAPPPDAADASSASAILATASAAHGRYLVEHVAMCVECHSSRDASGVILPETRFLGGEIPFHPPWPNDWATRAPRNAGLPGYSDEAAMRLLTEGAIGRQGVRLRPPMPRFRMTREDAADVIAFMRSIT